MFLGLNRCVQLNCDSVWTGERSLRVLQSKSRTGGFSNKDVITSSKPSEVDVLESNLEHRRKNN